MENSFLADSDFLIALYSKDDANHARALSLLEKISELPSIRFCISVLVYSEVVTVLSQRVAQKTAHFFMEDIELHGITFLYVAEESFRIAQDVFRKQRSKNTSFVDAVNIALMLIHNFTSLLSFDRDYMKNGISLFRG